MQVKWSRRAGRALDTALAQGAKLFGIRATTLFYNRVKSYEPLLASNPYMGKAEPLLANRTRHSTARSSSTSISSSSIISTFPTTPSTSPTCGTPAASHPARRSP